MSGVLLMAVPTPVIVLLPTWADIGIAAARPAVHCAACCKAAVGERGAEAHGPSSPSTPPRRSRLRR